MTPRIETANAGAYANATEADLQAALGRLDAKNRYVVIRREGDDETFAQACFDLDESGRYAVEYLHKPRELRRAFVDTSDAAYELLAGWAFDHAGWRQRASWESVDNDDVVDFAGACEWTTEGDELVVRFAPLSLEARGETRKQATAALMLALEDATQDRDTALKFSAWCGEHIVKRADLTRRDAG